MSWRRELSKLLWFFHRQNPIDDVDEEIKTHLQMEEEANRELGMSSEEAYYAARQRFGNVTLARERSREMWRWTNAEVLLQDLRYGVRQLRRNPAFSAVAVLVLSLGIGVNTAVFTAYKTMVVRPVDARDPGEIVDIALLRSSGSGDFLFSYPDYVAYRDFLHSFRGLLAFRPEHLKLSAIDTNPGQRTAEGKSAPKLLGLPSSPVTNAEFANVFAVSENYFQVLGASVLRGRAFEAVGVPALVASPSVLISENYWERRFNRDPAILEKTIRLNQVTLTVIGITPHDFVGTGVGVPDFWLPISLEPLIHVDENWLRDRENQKFRLDGRLAPGVSISQAQAEVNLLANHLRNLHDPRSNAVKPVTALVSPGSPFPLPLKMYRGLILTILLIMSAAGMVLVIACANVASLQLARSRSRQAEFQTRLALGASRLRLTRQLLTESALLGLLAGAIALPLTWALLRVAVVVAAGRIGPENAALVFNVTPDFLTFAFVCAVSLIAGILFGFAPAIETSRSGLSSSLRGGTSPIRTRRLQDLFLAVQVSLSLVLLIAAGMLIRSSINTLNRKTGYESKKVVDLNLQFPEGPNYNASRKAAFVQELRTKLTARPEVVAITSGGAPDDNTFRTASIPVSGGTSSPHRGVAILHYAYVESNYFQTLGVPLLLGHSFHTQAVTPEHSVILSESAAKQLWPGKNPIGRNLRLGPVDERFHNDRELIPDGPTYQVTGLARDTRGVEFDGSDSRKVYLPLAEKRLSDYPMLVRSQINPAQVIRAITPMINSIDPDVTVTVTTLDELLRYSAPFIASRMAGAVASSVGVIGLMLALLGIYGTVNYIVVLRTREVGIRMALGARKHDILGLILRESIRPVLVGLLAGMVLAVGASYLLRGLLYGLPSIDSVSFFGVSLLFLAIAVLAAYPPSRQAMNVDPQVALRYE